ncbi:MAG: c-type cytochrome [Pirellulaceae bacterium]
MLLVGGGMPGAQACANDAPLTAQWDDAASLEQWRPVSQCTVESGADGLTIQSTGRDPHLETNVDLPAGWSHLVVEATVQGAVRGQVFFANGAGYDEKRSSRFEVRGGRQASRQTFDVYWRSDAPVTALRLDPLDRPGTMLVHRMTVLQEEPPVQEATPVEKIRLADGFKIERIYNVPGTEQGSWVSLTTDERNRLIASDQYGKLYRITPPPIGSGESATVELINVDLGMCQGLLCAFDSLYAVVNGNAGQGAGLYRLRDTNGDDQYDEVTLLRSIEGGGEHGPHAVILSPDGQGLFVCGGNHTKIPNPERSRVPRNWDEDQLLPSMPDAGGHAVGIRAPGGWICKTDPDGKSWELYASGFRNEYDIAFSLEGELFTYDADMEWDVGAPWYRPTRVNHVTSGAEFGWRTGTAKWPAFYPDSLGSIVDIGPGSPTGIVFGTGAKFPEAYQRALFIADWSYGIIYSVHMEPDGATYRATAERFCSAPALQVTDLVVGPQDGALYFAIGGRRTQSGLYRVTYVGDESTAPVEPLALTELQRVRRRLETLHGNNDPSAVATAWGYLGHEDRTLRFTARVALEHQPVDAWRDKLSGATNPRTAIAATIALARCGTPDDQALAIETLNKVDVSSLSESDQLDLMRAYGVVAIRLGGVTEALRDGVIATFDGMYPASDATRNRELCRLLVAVDAPGVASRTLDLLQVAPTQEEQIHYAYCLRVLGGGSNQAEREAYFAWFNRAAALRGGHSFGGFLANIRKEAIDRLSPPDREALRDVIEALPQPVDALAELRARPVVQDWEVGDLFSVDESVYENRDIENGRRVFATAQCFKCHRFEGEGGLVGPDLTASGRRFNQQNLLEALVEPSKVVSDQYQATLFVMDDGQQIAGRVINLNGDNFMVQQDMMNPGDLTSINSKFIEEMTPSAVSMMPDGLLDTFSRDEIHDLIAFLRSASSDTDDKDAVEPGSKKN